MDALAIPKVHIESLHVFYVCLGELLPYLIPSYVCGTHIDLLISFVQPKQKQIAMAELSEPRGKLSESGNFAPRPHQINTECATKYGGR